MVLLPHSHHQNPLPTTTIAAAAAAAAAEATRMEQTLNKMLMITLSYFLILLSVSSTSCVHAYKNHTVGDSLGWYDSSEKPHLDYQKWAAANNFSLGDFLIFNTNTNHSIVQTYNVTTYKLCDYDNSVENDTIQWSDSDPSNTATHDVTVAVPLVKEGITYFFSGDYDGDQCRNGQHFEITVTHGQGLPKSTDDGSATGPASSPESGNGTGDDQPTPDTIVPNSNFNDPKEEDDSDDDKQSSASVAFSVQGNLMFILLGLVYLFCS